ncbi:hypothetical protein SADUNF_Sadunf13G0102500 [Salix dunnii]|uniref:Uncharacterized protein n=1 Tax=Salix dunnii TaxID=1413687 RepID=A0A835ML95_9ROSI|nr:hypothetical protein SADUNF_Sadunf13G0102500 [Salix dunnii]
MEFAIVGSCKGLLCLVNILYSTTMDQIFHLEIVLWNPTTSSGTLIVSHRLLHSAPKNSPGKACSVKTGIRNSIFKLDTTDDCFTKLSLPESLTRKDSVYLPPFSVLEKCLLLGCVLGFYITSNALSFDFQIFVRS